MLYDTHNKEQDTDEPEISPCKAISLVLCHNGSVLLIREYRTNIGSFTEYYDFVFLFSKIILCCQRKLMTGFVFTSYGTTPHWHEKTLEGICNFSIFLNLHDGTDVKETRFSHRQHTFLLCFN